MRRRERMRNPKCLGGDFPDTFSARSAHLTGLKIRRITRAVSCVLPQPEGHTLPHRRMECRVVHHSKFGGQCLSWVIHVIPAIPACPVSPKSGHSTKACVYEYTP